MTTSVTGRRQAVVDLLASSGRAMHINEIATRLGVEPRAYAALRSLLDEMSERGSVVALAGQRFRLTRKQVEDRGVEIQGILSVHPRGFGFLTAVGQVEDVYVPRESMLGALHGDTVVVRVVTRSRRGIEGEVARVVQRRSPRVAGTLRVRGRSAWLEPDDTRIRGPIVVDLAAYDPSLATDPRTPVRRRRRGDGVSAADGMAAVVTIGRFPETADENPEGVLEAVIGEPGEPNVEVAKVLVREGVDEEHPRAAIDEAHAFGHEVPRSALAGREDLTHLPLPTIDPEDARDHDDAVWVRREEDGSYKAWIAIADVSAYVQPGTSLDACALSRGNSIYLPDRAIPMLPAALSSHLCSLVPDALRLCLCVEVDLDPTAVVRGTRIVEGTMRSAAALTYPGVARALGFTKNAPRSEEAEAMRDDLHVMWDLARLLRARRMRRGALDLDLPEARVLLDPETGAPVDVQKRSHDPGVKRAYQLIEELMLLANECVAGFLAPRRVPTVFRVHAPPDLEKLARFAALCHELDIPFDPEEATEPKRLASLLKRLSGHPQQRVLQMLFLRSMKQAAYDVANVGHFGLASTAYLHFTSPIRRYPDLLVHRAVRALLRKEPIDTSDGGVERLRKAATTASECERRGMEIEREVVDLYRALFMRDRIGEVLEGTVTGIVGAGVFVSVDQPFVDVLVRLESLGPDRYDVDEDGLHVVGVRSGDRVSLGDSMVLEIEDVAVLRRTVYGRRVAPKATRRARGSPEAAPRPRTAKRKAAPPKRTRTARAERPPGKRS